MIIGAIASGWSGLAITAGLVLLALAVQLLITGRARWAFIASGAAPIRAGDPGCSSKLDRDGDGIACET